MEDSVLILVLLLGEAESVVLLHLLHPDQVLQGWLPFSLPFSNWAAFGVNIH